MEYLRLSLDVIEGSLLDSATFTEPTHNQYFDTEAMGSCINGYMMIFSIKENRVFNWFGFVDLKQCHVFNLGLVGIDANKAVLPDSLSYAFIQN